MPNLFLLSPGSLCAEQEREVEEIFKHVQFRRYEKWGK